MPMNKDLLLRSLAALAARYSGTQNVRSESLLYSDLGLNGSDFIEFIEKVEQLYSVDLEVLSPRSPGKAAQETSIEGLADLILTQRKTHLSEKT